MINKINLKKAAIIVNIGAIITIICASIMMTFGGGSHAPYTFPNDYGFTDAIIWFELVDSAEEVFLVLGPSQDKTGQRLRESLDQINLYDFLFMSAYSLFHIVMFLFLIRLGTSSGLKTQESRLAWSIGTKIIKNKIFPKILFAVLFLFIFGMWFGDIMENIQLFKLTKYQDADSIPKYVIVNLQIWTRMKWVALFLSLIFLGISYLHYYGKSFWSLSFFLFFTGFVCGMISISFQNYKALLEPAAALMAICWIWVWIHSIIILLKND